MLIRCDNKCTSLIDAKQINRGIFHVAITISKDIMGIFLVAIIISKDIFHVAIINKDI